MSMNSTMESISEQPRPWHGLDRTMLATLALCLSTFTHTYLLISVFPYSGFMAIELIPSANSENAGNYAGLIASAFMVGRAMTSYQWGKLADKYGRTSMVNVSLLLSGIITMLFGLSRSFPLALFWRFLLGFFNGILIIAKTAVCDLAKGDEELETRGTGLVLSMWGMGFLVSPVISGAMAEPMTQYSDWEWLQKSFAADFLRRYPFFLPNVIGMILCILSTLAVEVFVEETLPPRKLRSVTLLPSDIAAAVGVMISGWFPKFPKQEETRLINSNGTHNYSNSTDDDDFMDATGRDENEDDEDDYGDFEDFDEDDFEIPSEVLAILEDDVVSVIKETRFQFNESVAMLSMPGSKETLTIAITSRSSVSSAQHRAERLSQATTETAPPATIKSLWAKASTRNHLIVYWVASFLVIAIDEGFPLFCLSKAAGLGLQENSIGAILSASGLMFAVGQYFVYSLLVRYFGLYGSIRCGISAVAPLVALMPLSLYFNRNATEANPLAFSTFLFLSIDMALFRVLGLAFFSSITVAMNRTVLPSHRGTMNGLATLGGSVAKGLGPAFAGILVAATFSGGLFEPHVGAVVMFWVIAGVGALTSLATFVLLREDNDGDGESVIMYNSISSDCSV